MGKRPFERGGTVGTMRIVDESGDSTLTWTIDDERSVVAAAEMFTRLAAMKRLAFARSAGAPASEAELVRHFDPEFEEIVWVRPVVGG
jgi:hypothetical protein